MSGDRMVSDRDGVAAFRLAFRDDDDFYTAYLAPMPESAGDQDGDRNDWFALATLRRRFIEDHPDIYEAWREFLTKAVEAACRELFGHGFAQVQEIPAAGPNQGRA